MFVSSNESIGCWRCSPSLGRNPSICRVCKGAVFEKGTDCNVPAPFLHTSALPPCEWNCVRLQLTSQYPESSIVCAIYVLRTRCGVLTKFYAELFFPWPVIFPHHHVLFRPVCEFAIFPTWFVHVPPTSFSTPIATMFLLHHVMFPWSLACFCQLDAFKSVTFSTVVNVRAFNDCCRLATATPGSLVHVIRFSVHVF